MIAISSYKDINGIAFGSRRAAVVSLLGEPNEISINQEGELELGFGGFILRFDAGAEDLRECTLLPGCDAKINGVPVIWTTDFLSWLSSEDKDLREAYGFILSLKLGLAVTGFHDGDESQKAIHAFRYGDWDELVGHMEPFLPTSPI